jgi:tetratricopeptide (TPR) repeat protein
VTTQPATGRAPHSPISEAGELAADMVARWRAGERPTAADYAARHPHLRADPDAALELIAEELALREEYGPPADPDGLAAAFPEWAAQVRALVRCRAAIGPPPGPRFPTVGQAFGEFRLVEELGRGAVGRVFLAVQPALADRPVVLKLTPAGGGEHLSLARLQHTHIVPLYSAHAFPSYGLEGLCLPYFGGATLAAALAEAGHADRPATGSDLLAALRAAPTAHVQTPGPGPAWAALDRAGYVDAVCWVTACLADALQYAHDRGLLHLDVKPSNVLLAGDGTPMLLDFHLARPPLRAGDPPPPVLGGTPGHMAPEQSAAVEAVRWHARVQKDVDARADVYALGVILRIALAAPRGPAAVRAPIGVLDVIARCTAANPARRYATAADVAADLRRHLADQPLVGVRNRSLIERWGKWRRRRPFALPLAAAAAALVAGGIGLAAHAAGRAETAEAAYHDGTDQLARSRYTEAAAAFRTGSEALAGLPFRRDLRDRLDAGRRAADRGRAADALREACDRVRPLCGAEFVTPAQAAALRAVCREVWDARDKWDEVTEPDGPEREDLTDLAVLLAELEVRAAPAGGVDQAHRQALAVLDEAGRRYGPRPALDLERADHLRALGRAAAADEAARRAAATPPRTARDHLAAGRAALAAKDTAGAAAHLGRAQTLDPRSFWVNYYAGLCRLRAGAAAEALAAFAACTAIAPDRAWCVYNRGLAYLELGRPDAAAADFDRALALDPDLGAALVARAAAYSRAGRVEDALSDLARAERAGIPPAEVEYRRAAVRAAAGDAAAAREHLRRSLLLDPGHQPAATLLARLSNSPDTRSP